MKTGRAAVLLLLLLSVLKAGSAERRVSGEDADLLPGWGSERKQPAIVSKKPYMEVLHEDARIFLFHHFLTDEECDHIVKKAEPRLSRSGVVDTSSGGTTVNNIRTSNGMFFERGEDAVIRDVEERIARWTLLPVGNGEGLQVLRYNLNQKYDAHWDYFFHKEGTANGGNRFATVLMYLSDFEEGGETVFPNIPVPPGRDQSRFSECARTHLAVKPKKGDAILFHSIKTTGELERRSMHGACPVLKGVKWSMAKWIHVGHYASFNEQPEDIKQHVQDDGSGCADKDPNCGSWADSGECENNPSFMIGTPKNPGSCLKSCDRCDLLRGVGLSSRKFGGATS